jgi:PASTA domain
MAKRKSRVNGRFRKVVRALRTKRDRTAAVLCILYLLSSLVAFSWLLFDTWIGNHFLLRALAYDLAALNKPSFRVVTFTVIAGGMGGIINGLRSTLTYYNGFNQRYAWKYITAPWMGVTLALFVYALISSSIVAFGGTATTVNISTPQILTNFAAGALAGYGSKDVLVWLDATVHRIFQVKEKVPDVTGKTQAAAISRLQAANLELGDISRVPPRNGKPARTVVGQSPAPQARIDRGESVDLSVARR